MIDFSIPQETQLLLDTIRKFVKNELVPLEAEVEELAEVRPERVAELRRKTKQMGMFGLRMPEECGGAGLSAVDGCLVEEEFGRTCDPLIRRAFGEIPGPLIHGSAEQRERYLLPAMQGEINVCLGMTEPAAGSDAAGIKTTARRDGDGWVINGMKHFITDGDIAHVAIVTAVTDPTQGAKGISTFLLERGMPGYRVGRVQEMMGQRGLNHAELFFDNVRVGPQHLLGEEGRGMNNVLSFVNKVRLGHVGARAVGMASRVLELCLAHAGERKQFGQAIGEFQMVQSKLAEMAADIFATRMMVLNAAWEIDQGREPREKVSIVKFYASEMIGRVADHGIQIFGGMGYTKEMPLERIYRDARVMRIYDGTSEIHRMVVARSMMRRGHFPL
jgi:acyl-CoA dehydrogenase